MSGGLSIEEYESPFERCRECLRTHARNPENCAGSCYSLIQSALASDDDIPWTYFYQAFEPWLTNRVRSYCFRYRLAPDMVDHFVNIAYFRFWKTLHGKPERLKNFQHAVNYMRSCARSTILDSVRSRVLASDEEVDMERVPAPPIENTDFDRLWQIVLEEITDEKDRLLVDCYILRDLKPKDIIDTYHEHWQTTEQIKVDWQRIRRQLRRNYGLRGWFGIDDTI